LSQGFHPHLIFFFSGDQNVPFQGPRKKTIHVFKKLVAMILLLAVGEGGGLQEILNTLLLNSR